MPETSASPAPSAEQLLAACAGGDQQSFAVLYDRFADAVYGICLRVLRDPHQAAEVAQEVWLEVWTSASRHDPARGTVRTWVLTVAHARAVDRVRSSQAQRVRDQRVLDAAAQPPFDEVAEQVGDADERAGVRRCLDGLTALQHEAVVLAYYGALTYREVAARLDVPLPTVKTRIRDGLARLKDCLGVSA